MSVLPLQLTPELMTGIPTDGGALPRVNDRAKQLVPVGVPRILLTTTCHLPSTARLAMEFADAGAQVAVLSPADHPALVMTFLSHRLTYHAMRPLRALRVAIERAAPDLVIPCDERAVRHLHQLHALARQHTVRDTIERSLGPPVSFGLTTTRHDLLMLARGQGVRVPDSMKLSTADDLKHWNARHKYPWVLKADGSWAGFGVRVVSSAPAAALPIAFIGILWMCLWRGRIRWRGLPFALAVSLWPRPDPPVAWIASDGAAAAVREGNGAILMRPSDKLFGAQLWANRRGLDLPREGLPLRNAHFDCGRTACRSIDPSDSPRLSLWWTVRKPKAEQLDAFCAASDILVMKAEVEMPASCARALVLRPVDFARGGALEVFQTKSGWRLSWAQPLRGDRPWTRPSGPEP
jgi:hypothetical protein